MLKRCRVVMLPTNEKARICVIKQLYYRGEDSQIDSLQNQHLYILSEDEIRKGDYYYTEARISEYGIHLCDSERLVQICKELKAKKVIATTDKSLNLPGISQSFIDKYIEKYNKGKVLKEVNVVYEEDLIKVYDNTGEHSGGYLDFNPDTNGYKPLIKSDNTISIKKVKTSWNREEVVKLLYKLWNVEIYTDNVSNWEQEDLEDWIRENL